MAVKANRPAPWWLTWAMCAGLVAVFLGERVVGHLPTAHKLLTGAGALAVLVVAAWRVMAFAQAAADRRPVDRVLLLGALGCVAALLLYFLGAYKLVGAMGSPDHPRLRPALGALWPIVLAVSLLPTIFAQLHDTAGRFGRDPSAGEQNVETYRIVEAASSGLTIALAGAFLFLAAWIAAERDHKVDVSYFRTSSPGGATRAIVEHTGGEPIRVLLFFPEVNEVKDEVRGYFDSLAGATGRLVVESHDRTLEAKLAEDCRVQKEGTIVIIRGERCKKGEKVESVTLGTEIAEARTKLRSLDEEVQKALMKVARAQKTAYLTVGHGEVNDRGGEPPDPEGLSSAAVFKQLLGGANYRVKDLGLKDGLGQDIPGDADIVVVFGPRKPLLDEELAALDRYAARGGSLLILLDPAGEASLGPLEKRLGVTFDRTPLADDKQYVRRRMNDSDRRLIVTNQFSSHASVTSLGRSRADSAIVLVNTGSLADVPTAPGVPVPKKTYVVRSLTSTFNDPNDNYGFDTGAEKRVSWNLAAAIEGPAPPAEPVNKPPPDPAQARGQDAGPADAKDKGTRAGVKVTPHGMRALVFADADLLTDGLLGRVRLNYDLAGDVIKWLGGEEQYSGETQSEKDVAIEHTKSQDVAWFYSTIVGAPVLVLACGLLVVARRRKPRAGKGAVS